MTKLAKRLLSFAVAMIMILSLIPVTPIEASADTTTQEPADTSVIDLPRSDGKKVKVDLDTVNDPLVAIGDVAEDGTMTAYCAACGENATWELLTAETEPKIAIKTTLLDQSHIHYYLNDDVTTNKKNQLTDLDGNGTIESNDPKDPVLKNKWEDQLFYLWTYQAGVSLCLHLNGHTLTNTNTVGYMYVGNGTLNVMGEGTFNGGGTVDKRGGAVTLNNNDGNGVVNLLGGNINSDTSRPAISASGRGGYIYIYPGATVERFYLQGGTITLEGGTINGDNSITNFTSNSKWINSSFVMNSGTINGRTAMTRVADAANTGVVTFTMNGGTINGKGTKASPYTGSGTAINMAEGSRLIINGGTINGGYSGYEYYVTGKDANDKNVYHDKRTWGGVIYTAPSWKNSDITKVQTYIEMNGGTINAAGQGTSDYIGYAGGAIYVYGYKAGDGGHPGGGTKFVMNGGTINGGKIAQFGGALYVNGAQVDLNGGTIQGGNAAGVGSNPAGEKVTYTAGQGGNIYISKGSATNAYFKLNGATVKDGDALAQGGNIYLAGIEMVMEKGTVSGGYIKAEHTGGGNIFVDGKSTLTMKGGLIANGINYWNQGGNIFVDAGTFNMSGGEIKNGVACNGASIAMKGESATDKAIVNITGGTISGGKTTGNEKYGRGGNMYIGTFSEVTVSGATITGGQASYTGTDSSYGGGNICLYGEGAKLTVGKNAETGLPGVISDGVAATSSGGNICLQTAKAEVILNDGAVVSGGKVQKASFYGGNIYVNQGTLTINKGASVIGGTSLSSGGNIFIGNNTDKANAVDLTINGGSITGGESGQGGNITISKAATVTMKNATISGGKATITDTNGYSGGGNIFVQNSVDFAVDNCKIYGGEAISGGNILTQSGSVLDLINGTEVYDGKATGTAALTTGGNLQTSGGTFNIGKDAKVYNGTVANNKGFEIGAIYGGAINVDDGQIGTAETASNNALYLYGTSANSTLTVEEGVVYGNLVLGSEKIAVNIKHGTFSMDPTAAKAEGTTVVEKDGLYEVHTYVDGLCACGAATGEAVVNGAVYETLEEALTAAKTEGGTVQMKDDIAVDGMLTINDNVILDLNGYTLSGSDKVVAAFTTSHIIDSSEDNSGRLDIDISNLYLMTTNAQLPVQMDDGIMFVDAATGNGWGVQTPCYQAWIDGMDNALVEALQGSAASELGLSFIVDVRWGNNGHLTHPFADETVAGYMADWQNYAIYLRLVSNIPVGEITYQARLVAQKGTGAEVVVWASNVITHQ